MTTVGCFGSVVYHDPKGRRCSACPQFTACAEKVAENATILNDMMDKVKAADRSTARSRKRAVTLATPSSLAVNSESSVKHETREEKPIVKGSDTSALNVKAAEFVQRWESKSLDFEATKRGENPFAGSGNKFAHVACDLLLQKGECTKMEMIDHLIANAGGRGPWGAGTASSHANIVFEAFEHLGIIVVTSGKAYLKR